MAYDHRRRSFLKNITLGGIGAATAPDELFTLDEKEKKSAAAKKQIKGFQDEKRRAFNSPYEGQYLNRIAFPIGGIGAGMFCVEGTGAISHMSVRHKPEIFNEPSLFAALAIKGDKTKAKVLEGSVPDWKLFGQKGTGNGAAGTTFGLPRFEKAVFKTSFPFATINLSDPKFPVEVEMTAWSPFIPTQEDDSSLPTGAIEYKFTNKSTENIEAVFSFNTKNFLAVEKTDHSIKNIEGGFVLHQVATKRIRILKAVLLFLSRIAVRCRLITAGSEVDGGTLLQWHGTP